MLKPAKKLSTIEKERLKQKLQKAIIEFNKEMNNGKVVSTSLEYNVLVNDAESREYLYADHNGERPYYRHIGTVIDAIDVKIQLDLKVVDSLDQD